MTNLRRSTRADIAVRIGLAAVLAAALAGTAGCSVLPEPATVVRRTHHATPTPPPRPAPVSDPRCSGTLTAWNAAMTAMRIRPLNPSGWTTGDIPSEYPVPPSDGRATPVGSCAITDSAGGSSVVAQYRLDDSGDWDSAYYYAVEFVDWSGSTANAATTVGDWRTWDFSKSAPDGRTLTTLILTSGSTMLVGYTATSGAAPAPAGGTGRITVVATFLGGSPACSGTDVHLTGPNGYTEDVQTGDDGTAVVSGLTPGTYAVTGGGGQAAHPIVHGAGVATATVTVAAGSDQTVQFGCD